MIIDSQKKLKAFFRAEQQKVQAAGNAVDKPSPYFGQIGSIPLHNVPYQQQVEIKQMLLKNILVPVIGDSLDITCAPSPQQEQYRFRMDYVCSHDPYHEPYDRFGQRKQGNFNWVINMETCPLLDARWFERTRKVYDFTHEQGIPNYDLVSHKGDLRYLVVRAHKNQGMLMLVTKTEEYADQIASSASFALEQGFTSVHWVVQPTQGDHIDGEIVQQWGTETIEVPILDKKFAIGSFTFFQNNIAGFSMLANWVRDYLENQSRTPMLYDVYAGVGTLGIVLHDLYDVVTGYEIVADSIDLARHNCTINDVENATYTVADLQKLHASVHIKPGETIVVDPPRAGLEGAGISYIIDAKPSQLIYISCNPITLAHDLKILQEAGFTVDTIKGFDLFPHTFHVETVAILRR